MSFAIEQQNKILTEEEYLRTEQTSTNKREYINGQVYAMVGAGYNHNTIAVNLAANFRNHLKATSCSTFMSDMKVRMGRDYVYPDVLVDCSQMSGQDYFSTAPVIIVEVLSKSTRKTDVTTKLLSYINIDSLQEYVLVEQDIVSVQVLRRANHWLSEYYFLGDIVKFDSIGLSLVVEEIYDRVDNPDMQEYRQQN